MPSTFVRRAGDALQDDKLRSALTRATTLLNRLRGEGYAATADFAELQAAARTLRRQALGELPALLQQLEANLLANGVQVVWAVDAEEARRAIVALAQARHAKTIVRSRSTVAEELGVDTALEAAGLHCVDTELGDAILQLSGDTPSHPVFPALHWRKEMVAALFTEQLDMPETVDIQSMASMARFKLRRRLLKADLSIGGVELAVAENGMLALAGDSGADRFGLAVARVHVAVMGIDQVVASPEELWFLLQMKARSAGGAVLPASVTLVDGPAGPDEPDGPDELVLVLVDNGRSDLLRWGYGEALACLRCGACLNACPVYREIGGQAYGGSPAGPIGSLVLPLLPMPEPKTAAAGQKSARFARIKRPARQAAKPPTAALATVLHDTALADLPHASTLCGACAEVCPVGIDIPRLLIRLRGDLVQAGLMGRRNQLSRRLFARSMNSPEHYDRLHRWLSRGSRPAGKTRRRRLPPPADRTFRERWQAAREDRR